MELVGAQEAAREVRGASHLAASLPHRPVADFWFFAPEVLRLLPIQVSVSSIYLESLGSSKLVPEMFTPCIYVVPGR